MAEARTLIDDLVPLVDEIRGIHQELGTRPYRVWTVRTRWTGGDRGEGDEVVVEEREILPTPRMTTGIDAMDRILHPVGADEEGNLSLAEISLTYTDTDLAPEVGDAEQFYYEVRDTKGGPRRRFLLDSAPARSARDVGWTLRLRSQDAPRTAAGRPWA